MKKIFTILFVCLAGALLSQTLDNQVINSAGETRQAGNIVITDNVGEPFTETIGPNSGLMITQGFLQPPSNDNVTILFNGLTCRTRDDGQISISLSNLAPDQKVQYIWSHGACPKAECGNKVDNLKPGAYFVTIISTYTNSGKTDTVRRGPIVIAGNPNDCRVVVFNAVTPNKDGINDSWFIENIDEFPNNRVTIYNRWGNQIVDIEGYDNVSKVWPQPDAIPNLATTTYFYIIDLGDGSKPMKGWVELLKN